MRSASAGCGRTEEAPGLNLWKAGAQELNKNQRETGLGDLREGVREGDLAGGEGLWAEPLSIGLGWGGSSG